MHQVRALILLCVFSCVTVLSAEEARRAELVSPPKKSAPEEAARALPVTAADKKETVAVAKKDAPSIEIDLGAKTTSPAKKDVSATAKKETNPIVPKDVAERKPVSAPDKKEVSAPAKKEVAAAVKKEIASVAKKEVSSVEKKDVPAAKDVALTNKKDAASPAKKEISQPARKEPAAAAKKEIALLVKKEVSPIERKEIPASRDVAMAEKAEAVSKTKKEFTFTDEKGKTVSAEVVDQYQNKRIVYPLAKTDHRVSAKLVHAASIAQDRARAHSKSACWHYVKNALLASGIISSYPKSVYAKEAGEELVRDYGFKKLPIRDPYQAPIGAVLVYGSRRAAGHVELRTKTGFVSDFQNKKPSKRPLIGVYAKA